MRLVCCLFIAVMGALAQAGAPIFTHAGPLACGMRLYAPGQVQEWCFDFRNTTNPNPKTICNAIETVTPLVPGDTLPVAASQSCFASDASNGNIYEVSWLVWQPIVALPPNSTGTIVYQIASTTQPCTVNTFGQCVGNGSPATTTMQTGSFSSGVLVAGLTTVETEGQPSMIIDNEPGPHWVASYGGGISVLNNDAMAQASWLGGFCRVTSDTPGTAQFVFAADDSVKVGWIPDGWCTDHVDLEEAEQPTLTGQCSPLGLTQFNSTGNCFATPDEPVRQAVNAHLVEWVQSPIVQGK